MATKTIRSRILQFFPKEALIELQKICRSNMLTDNNLKVDAMIDTLRRHNIDFVELGPGTNRLAILIDNYVFKIALDKLGIDDNINEFALSQELQPFVVKTYETNDLITVSEYVTVISREEFIEKKEEIQEILAMIADAYLLGDVGTVARNFCNWGYRDNGELVILDFAYLYRVRGDELLCSDDGALLEYDQNFHDLICPICGKKYKFMDIRRRISVEDERKVHDMAKNLAFKLHEPIANFKDGYTEEEPEFKPRSSSLYTQSKQDASKEETKMFRDYDEDDRAMTEEEQEESYLQTLQLLKQMKNTNMSVTEATDVQTAVVTHKPVANTVEIERSTADSTTSVRVVQHHNGQADNEESVVDVMMNAAVSVEQAIQEAEQLHDFTGDEEEMGDLLIAEMEQEGFSFSHHSVSASDDQSIVTEETVTVDTHEGMTVINEQTVTVIKHEQDDEEDADGPIIIDVDLEDPDQGIVLESDAAQPDCDGDIVVQNSMQLTDTIKVDSTITIKGDSEAADELRRQLALDEEEKAREKIESLASQYSHLDDEDEPTYTRKGGNKQWD